MSTATSSADKRRLFQDTVARPIGHKWHLMNRQDRGFGERSIAYNTLLEICQDFDVKLGERGSDKHGEFVRVLVNHDDRCEHRLEAPRLAPQRNALRIETQNPGPRCSARPKPGMEGMVLRWIGSGGSAIAAAYPCFGRGSASCPKRVSSSPGGSNG